MDVLGGPTATTAESTVQAEHRLNLARQIRKMAENQSSVFRYERSLRVVNFPEILIFQKFSEISATVLERQSTTTDLNGNMHVAPAHCM